MDARFDAYIKGEEIINIQMDIAHSGDFGFHAKLDYMLGAQYAGKYANLFYIVEPGKYDFIQSCQIDANGMATFILNHASSYIVVIRDEEYVGDPIVQATPAPTPQPTPEVTEAITKDADNTDVSVSNVKNKGAEEEVDGEIITAGIQKENVAIGSGIIGGSVAVVVVAAGVAMAYFIVRTRKER